ncbi:MAG TPA: hypothetical protein VKU82_06245 [Planctomycetaceae bacterium]|nr:hypothetical protein [Planctomycetaceae bacterium]
MFARRSRSQVEADEEKPPRASRAAGIARQLYRPMTLATAAAVVTAGLFLPRLMKELPDLGEQREYRIESRRIEIAALPHWVPHDLVAQVVDQAGLPAELSLLDDGLAGEIAEAFRLSPWVDEVVSVRKSFPAKIAVVLNYRRPVGMVEVKQGKYPIDAHGVLLPPQDFSVADTRAYPVVSGVVSTPQGPAGTRWGDGVVEGAARLAAELGPLWKKLELAAIVCPRTTERRLKIDEGVFVLMSKGGSRIIWGHAPGDTADADHPGELSTKQKIGRLTEYVKRFGGFDKPQGPYQIDIRHWRDISRTPLSAELEWLDQVRE